MGGQNISRCAVALAHEIIKQGKKALTLTGCNLSIHMDIIVGAGLVKKCECGLGGLGRFGATFQFKRAIEEKRMEIESDIQTCYDNGPKLAMVNSDKGITNLHVPSDVIIDASMPAAIRNSGQMWGPDGKLHDTKFVIPDSSYAGVYKEAIEFCKKKWSV